MEMGIFNGSESLFYLLGALTLALVFGLIYMHKIYNFKWYATLLAALGIFQTVFTMAWWISSIQEGEPQAGNMGLLAFGALAMVRRRSRRIWSISRPAVSGRIPRLSARWAAVTTD